MSNACEKNETMLFNGKLIECYPEDTIPPFIPSPLDSMTYENDGMSFEEAVARCGGRAYNVQCRHFNGQVVGAMTKNEAYDLLFRGVADMILHRIDREADAVALAKIALRSKPAIIREYIAIENAIRKTHAKGITGNLDRHKCAAAFMLAFERWLIIERDNARYEQYRENIAYCRHVSYRDNRNGGVFGRKRFGYG